LKSGRENLAKILTQVVEVCVFRHEKGEPRYLILQRSTTEDLYPNIWQIVTGTIMQNENAIDAAKRELNEETGLKITRFWTVPFVDSYFDLSKDAVQFVPVFASEVDGSAKPRLSAEHQNYEWMEYSAAIERLVWPGQRQCLEIVHSFIIGEKEAGKFSELSRF
jgi:dATP pyrophosphohydrolase